MKATAILFLSLVFAAAATASTPPAQCSVHQCHAHVIATPKLQRWVSPQKFGPGYTIEMEVSVDGHPTPVPLAAGCNHEWTGHGVSFRGEVCGRGQVPIRLSYVSFRGHHRVEIGYQAIGSDTQPAPRSSTSLARATMSS